MEFLTNDKLLIVGAGGMIGSNMVQSALMLGLTQTFVFTISMSQVFMVYSMKSSSAHSQA